MERVTLSRSQPGQQPQTHSDLHIYTLIVSQSEERRNSSPLTLLTQKTVNCVSHSVRSLRHGCRSGTDDGSVQLRCHTTCKTRRAEEKVSAGSRHQRSAEEQEGDQFWCSEASCTNNTAINM